METIDLEILDGVATITLNRPDAGNAMNLQFGEDILAVARACEAEANLRVVLLTAKGRLFCAGGDVGAFAAAAEPAALIGELLRNLHPAIEILRGLAAPIVTAVNGTAAGAGMSLALAGDLVLVAESAKFTAAYTGIALSPDGSMTHFLPRLIGLRRAQEMMITNRVVTAAEALDWGMITQVVANDELLTVAGKLVAKLAAGPTAAFGSVKKLLHQTDECSLAEQLAAEATEIVANAGHPDGREGIAAFAEKRKPTFRGR
ncbi:MAG: enoyl-CoA hydratase-related protein [Deltaproteobacteria bacterium]